MTAPATGATGTTAVVGTAGHVDHGKSTLVRALTGIDPDRLAEERARGLTIDLGFAHTMLTGGITASFVDVPGHEDFIRNMLAGVGGVSACVLVVAADEGPMPQTREHLAILDQLGLSNGVVALTKVDLVDDESWLDLVSVEVAEMLAGTTLEGSPIVPISATTGEGLDELRAALAGALSALEPPPDRGRPRLSVDRAFTLAGHGTVVTGTLRDGGLDVGGALALLPSGQAVRCRALHTHGQGLEHAPPGTRVAVNLAGIGAEEIERGDVLCLPDSYRATGLLDAMMTVVPDAPGKVSHDDEVLVFHGAAAVPARVRPVGARAIDPGESGPVQLVLTRPLVCARGDRFVLRRPSPGTTVGGGRVLDSHPGRRWPRFREPTIARFAALAGESHELALWQLVATRQPCDTETIAAAATDISAGAVDRALAGLTAAGRIEIISGLYVTDEWAEAKDAAARKVLTAYHRRHALRPGPPREEVRERLRMTSDLFRAWLDSRVKGGWLAVDGPAVRLADHRVTLEAPQQAEADALLRWFQNARFAPPSLAEAQDRSGKALVEALVARGDLVVVCADIALAKDAYQAMRAEVAALLAAEGGFTVSELRDRLGTSRKYVLGMLEHLDGERVTRRVGDVRVAGAPAPPRSLPAEPAR